MKIRAAMLFGQSAVTCSTWNGDGSVDRLSAPEVVHVYMRGCSTWNAQKPMRWRVVIYSYYSVQYSISSISTSGCNDHQLRKPTLKLDVPRGTLIRACCCCAVWILSFGEYFSCSTWNISGCLIALTHVSIFCL